VRIIADGMFAEIAPDLAGKTVQVNSLHGQGIDRLSPRLRVEAEAPTGPSKR
jgi:gamma-glutamyl-gamma-aminobutyrate hydrolase PuuD